MNASQYQESLRIINCLPLKRFKEIFADMGDLWCEEKFDVLKRDVVGFVGNLDESNAKKLFDYLGDRLDQQADELNIKVNSKR